MSLGGMIVKYHYNGDMFKGRIQDKVKTTSFVNDGMVKKRTDVEDHYLIEMTEYYDIKNEWYLKDKGRALHLVRPVDISCIVT